PAPGLAVLDDLVTTFRQAGLPVEVARADEGAAPPSAVDLAAYRIIQEALTNVRKHAGDQARAEVSVVRVGLTLEVTVLDDGPSGRVPAPAGPRDPDAPEGGHGLIGMRERVAALGGRLSAGPRYGGGFRVQAILPLTARTGEDI
ncbi:sensor histidine kinase, partial [Streptomyces clavuligerus]